jgi:type I restriction enzyme M protein
VVLGLVFLKYVSEAFEARRDWLATAAADPKNADYYLPNEDRRQGILEVRDEFTSENVFWDHPASRSPDNLSATGHPARNDAHREPSVAPALRR